jgi:hypothetical protein
LRFIARAKRHVIPGYIRHITHRHHKREFLLKNQLSRSHRGWVEEQLQVAAKEHQDGWKGSIAVRSKAFIDNVKARLGFRVKGPDVIEAGEGYQLRENLASYKRLFDAENEDIDLENTYFWNVKSK